MIHGFDDNNCQSHSTGPFEQHPIQSETIAYDRTNDTFFLVRTYNSLREIDIRLNIKRAFERVRSRARAHIKFECFCSITVYRVCGCDQNKSSDDSRVNIQTRQCNAPPSASAQLLIHPSIYLFVIRLPAFQKHPLWPVPTAQTHHSRFTRVAVFYSEAAAASSTAFFLFIIFRYSVFTFEIILFRSQQKETKNRIMNSFKVNKKKAKNEKKKIKTLR